MKASRTSKITVGAGINVKFLAAIPLLLASFALILQFSPNADSRGDLNQLDVEHTFEKNSVANNDVNQLLGKFKSSGPLKIAFVATTSDHFKQIRMWHKYHYGIGVTNFYLFVDGVAAEPSVAEEIASLPGITIIFNDDDLKYKHDHSRIWNETWLAGFFHKPCNNELFVKQTLNMEEAIRRATADKIDWIFHIDTDELVYPHAPKGISLQAYLASIPNEVDTLVFPNWESLPENENVSLPFMEVSLFKKSYHHVDSAAFYENYQKVAHGNPNYFVTYGNGKAAARIQAGLRPNGAHRWYNYNKAPEEWTLDDAAVLHYTYNRYSDMKSRRDRCDCAPTRVDAEKCFMLPFDRDAFLAASYKSDEELMQYYIERVVWNNETLVKQCLKNGLFERLYLPQLIINEPVI